MNDREKKIHDKADAIRSDAHLAKQQFDHHKHDFDQLPYDNTDTYESDLADLRHELKLMLSLLSESKFDEIVHIIANPSKLMGLNLLIGFVRGIGFCLAILIIVLIILTSLSDVLFVR